MKEIYALGVGTATPLFCEIAEEAGYKIAGLYHYKEGRKGEIVNGYEILGSFDELFSSDISGKYFLMTMGEMSIKKELTDRIEAKGGIVPTVVHPSAIIYKSASISDSGVIIGPGVIVQSNAIINKGVMLRDMVLVCHNAVVDEYVFVGPKALIGSCIHVSRLVFVGQSSTLISKKANEIGENALIGAGALVTKDVPANYMAIGVPAKIVAKNH